MTMRGRFFTRSEYMQHVYSALVNFPAKIKTFPPAIVKSKEGPLWSGKQVNRVRLLNNNNTVWGGRLCKRFCNVFSGSSPCLLGQHSSCGSAKLPVELSENMLQNLLHNLPPQAVIRN